MRRGQHCTWLIEALWIWLIHWWRGGMPTLMVRRTYWTHTRYYLVSFEETDDDAPQLPYT